MGKSDKEKQMLYEWGKTNSVNYYFQGIDKEKKSYYIRREETKLDKCSYIHEYGFETLPEFMKELDILWGDESVTESIKKVIGVATIKNKPERVIPKKVETVNRGEPEDKLPAFIYNF